MPLGEYGNANAFKPYTIPGLDGLEGFTRRLSDSTGNTKGICAMANEEIESQRNVGDVCATACDSIAPAAALCSSADASTLCQGGRLIDNADNISCNGTTCQVDIDTSTCCKARCHALDTCRSGALAPDATGKYCAGAQCDLARDENTCCAPYANCDSHDNLCGNGTLKQDSSALNCSSWQCGPEDMETCCDFKDDVAVEVSSTKEGKEDSVSEAKLMSEVSVLTIVAVGLALSLK